MSKRQNVRIVKIVVFTLAWSSMFRAIFGSSSAGLLDRLCSCCSKSWKSAESSCFCSLISLQQSDNCWALVILSSNYDIADKRHRGRIIAATWDNYKSWLDQFTKHLNEVTKLTMVLICWILVAVAFTASSDKSHTEQTRSRYVLACSCRALKCFTWKQ